MLRRLLFVAAVLLLPLGGCAIADALTKPLPSATGTTSEGDVYALREGYQVVLKAMDPYVNLRRCGAPTSPKLCSQQKVADQLVLADRAAKTALDNAENLVRNAPEVSGVSAYSAAKAAISTVKEILAVYAN